MPSYLKRQLAKPVKLEFNNSGSWKCLGTFDAADDITAGLVLDHAEKLVQALHGGDAGTGRCPTMRVATPTPGDSTTSVLMHWAIDTGWRDAVTGDPL